MNGIAGIWDLARSGGSLGRLVILLEELEIQRQIHRAERVDVVFVADARQLLDGIPSEPSESSNGPDIARSGNIAAMVAVAKAMSGIADCHVCLDRAALDRVKDLIRSGCAPWPDPARLVRGEHDYDSTQTIREFHARTGRVPRLSVNAARLAWAKRYLESKSEGRLPVAVHLKNQPSGQSNADAGAWLEFLSSLGRDGPAHFFLVGDDATNAGFRSLPNVTLAQDDGTTVDGYLALIQAAGLFMGMMSGPANMALFGSHPYLIFKHPDHHAREMAMELGDADHYPFALPGQRVLRIRDTAENLVRAFESVAREVRA